MGRAIPRNENQNGTEMINRTALALETIAERLYANRELTVDPGDAVYEQAQYLYARSIEDSIENTTEYTATVVVDNVGDKSVRVQSVYTPADTLIRDYGTDVVDIPMGNRSLMDIINELRTQNTSSIYNKYR